MELKMLDAAYHTDPGAGCLCRYVRSDTERFKLHYHNYYELFLILKGEVHHIVNSEEQLLNPGQLLFIRDFDIHNYRMDGGEICEFINLAFTREMFESMLSFLGEGFSAENLLSSPVPPSTYLTESQRDRLFYRFTELNQSIDKKIVKTKAKALLIDIFTQYFFEYRENKTNIPSWLETVYEKMQSPQNFIEGTEKMYALCGRSREHLCRSLKKYYNTTPSALIRDLRLEYSVNLLLTSNLSITDICYESGFENLSWFYKQFAKKYGMTPIQYRKKYETHRV